MYLKHLESLANNAKSFYYLFWHAFGRKYPERYK